MGVLEAVVVLAQIAQNRLILLSSGHGLGQQMLVLPDEPILEVHEKVVVVVSTGPQVHVIAEMLD